MKAQETHINTINFYELNSYGTKWIKTTKNKLKRGYRYIKLYDKDLCFCGIGIYKKQTF